MKVITSIQGSVIIRYSPDDAAPDVGVLTRDLVAFLGTTYNFSAVPDVPPGLLLTPQPFTFQAGKISIDDTDTPINQLTLLVGALIITAKDTDVAERIGDEVISTIDRVFGFKLHSAEQRRYYQSNLSIETDIRIEVFNRAESILNREIPRPQDKPFALKRLAFGAGDVVNPWMQVPLDDIQTSDFVLERRPGEPYERNRYFSSAPTRTRDHERILSLVERALRG
jgi:hypothetical protein